MSAINTATIAAPSSDTKSFSDEDKRIINSRLGGVYAVPVIAAFKAGTIGAHLQCLPMVVLKGDNVKDSKTGERINVAQCQWALTAALTFGDIDTATTFTQLVRDMQTKGDTALCVLSTDGPTVSVFWGTCTVGVSPAKGRGNLATAICAALPPAVSPADVDTIREGITGEATKRNGPDISGKVNAAKNEGKNEAITVAIAAMIAHGINPAAAPYLARGEELPAGILPMLPKSAGPGRK